MQILSAIPAPNLYMYIVTKIFNLRSMFGSGKFIVLIKTPSGPLLPLPYDGDRSSSPPNMPLHLTNLLVLLLNVGWSTSSRIIVLILEQFPARAVVRPTTLYDYALMAVTGTWLRIWHRG